MKYVMHEIIIIFKNYCKRLRSSLGTYPYKKDALQIGSAGCHLRNVISLRDTQGMEKDYKNCKYFNKI